MKKILSAMAALWLIGTALTGTAAGGDGDGLTFDNAWVRAMPPGMNMTAAFGTLRNTGAAPMVITAFSSPAFGDVSLHRTERVDGVSRMLEVPELDLPPGGAVELLPGGYHLMLMMPREPLEPGVTITVRITADSGQTFRFEIPVERR